MGHFHGVQPHVQRGEGIGSELMKLRRTVLVVLTGHWEAVSSVPRTHVGISILHILSRSCLREGDEPCVLSWRLVFIFCPSLGREAGLDQTPLQVQT